MVAVEPATGDDVDALADLWVALAESQRDLGSHLLADENRAVVRTAVAQAVMAGEVVVARDDDLASEESVADEESAPGEESEDAIVGFAMAGIQSGTYEQDATRGVVQNVFVVPERRDEGVGSDLLAAAEDMLRDAGADVLSLEVMADNDDARRFYRRHGYRPHRLELEKDA